MLLTPNAIYQTDALIFLARIKSRSIQLVYLDPPWFPDDNPNPTNEELHRHLIFLSKVIQHCHRVLAESGCLFFHCTPHITHNIRFLADQVFGRGNFVSHFISPRKSLVSSGFIPASQHNDVILYGKSDLFSPVPSTRPLNDEELTKFNLEDEKGRYMISSLHSGFSRLELVFEWQGHKPSKGWRYSKNRLDELHRDGLIHFRKNGEPMLKQYLHDNKEVLTGNIWSDLSFFNSSRARTRYATQQPISLLQRILSIGSHPNDTVLDPFCGAGTTLIAAQSMGRRWLGCDNEEKSVTLTTEWLESEFKITPGADYMLGDEENISCIPEAPIDYTAFVTGLEDPISFSPLILQQLQVAQSLRLESTKILRLITRGENQVLEIKNAAYWNHHNKKKDPSMVENIVQAIVGFLNSKGGEILIGVDDSTREIVGLSDDYRIVDSNKPNRDGFQLALENKLKDSLPAHCLTLYDFTFPRVDGVELCLISVKRSNVPVFYQGKFFVRKGNGNRYLSTEEAIEYIDAHFKHRSQK